MQPQMIDKAASLVLDALWEVPEVRRFFNLHGYTLADLGPLVHRVFVPAYLRVKQALQGGELEQLEAQVTGDLLAPLNDHPHFREMWDAWDAPTRAAFLREQSEMALARLLVTAHPDQLTEAYQQAFRAFLAER